MKINQYEFLKNGKPFEPTRGEIIQFAEHELKEKDKEILILKHIIKKEHPEIERITDTNNELTIILDKIVSTDEKAIRHQVCEEIREKLDQIEQGKIK